MRLNLEGNAMKTVLLSALVLGLTALTYAGDDNKPKDDQNPTAQAPAAAKLNGAAPGTVPTNPDADPSKMGAPPIAPGGKTPGAAPVNNKTYVIGAEDELGILIWQNRELSSNYRVRPDGFISMPLIGEIHAAGKTPETLGQEVQELLSKGGFLRNPNVTIQVMAVNSRKYYITGEVNRTGSFPLVVPTTVLEALSQAGGFHDFANKSKITILRINPGGKPQTFRFNYKEVIKGKNLKQNIQLEPGDQIIVK
jgi:polysaccharide biosynthesis/export protein